MPLRVVIFGKTLLVRQPIAQSLGALDFQVFESASLPDVVAGLDMTAPVLIVMDADGMAREWRLIASTLGAKRGASALVLVTSRFGFDDAHDAMALKVAGVIVKPFRREEHTPRLLDIALRQANRKARRGSPRFSLTPSDAASVDSQTVRNIAEGGALIETTLEPGRFVPLATMTWGDSRLETSLDVIHATGGAAGVHFSRVLAGASKFLRALEERRSRALGPQGKKRKW
jgi:DNA-binding NarL/FixJ family response regulator